MKTQKSSYGSFLRSLNLDSKALLTALLVSGGLAACETPSVAPDASTDASSDGTMSDPCPVPPPAGLSAEQLELLSYGLTDGYLPSVTRFESHRMALPVRSLTDRTLALRVWSGQRWETWRLSGATSGSLWPLEVEGRLEVLVSGRVGSRDGLFVFREKSDHSGMELTQEVSGLRNISVSDIGGLVTRSRFAAVGRGTDATGATRMALFERHESTGQWSSSLIQLPDMVGFVNAQGVGYSRDAEPFAIYLEAIGTRNLLKISHRRGGIWLPGQVLHEFNNYSESNRVDVAVQETASSASAYIYWTAELPADGSMINQLAWRRLDLESGLLDESQLYGSAACSTCRRGTIEFEPNAPLSGLVGLLNNASATNTAWVAEIRPTGFEELQLVNTGSLAPTGSVRGYFDSCGNRHVTFKGVQTGSSTPADFHTIRLIAE
jgi:hypothetical protein